jgi:hypothetical protein
MVSLLLDVIFDNKSARSLATLQRCLSFQDEVGRTIFVGVKGTSLHV